MKKEDVIQKIKKLMAIANDPSASDQEIQLSTYKAQKLMIQFKIEEYELFGKVENQEVMHIELDQTGSGYYIWVLNVLSKYFRCKSAYSGKINTNHCSFSIYGLKDDVEILFPIANAIIQYLNYNIKMLKECYIGEIDFRIYKRDYISGFSEGLKQGLNKSILEMNLDKKYEVMITEIPAQVEKMYVDNVKIVKCKFKKSQSPNAYELGKKHGVDYDINNANLIF